jgi:CRP-like cAMP-binding protein
MTRPAANVLLALLPAEEYAGLQPHLEPVSVPIRTVLHEPGQPISHVYFPTSGVVSLLTVPDGSQGVESGVVGREGFAGLPVFLGTDRTTGRSVVQVHLHALRMATEDFRTRVARDGLLHTLLLRYAHFLLCQVSQSLACGVSHPIEQRLCRWLLLIHDRSGDRFPLTHELMANLLGVRRASISEVAGDLQQRGLIRYRRGQMDVLDRPGLERTACECFRVIRSEWDRLFGPPNGAIGPAAGQ